MDLKLMMEPSDLSKAGYESVCATRACEDVIKLSLVNVLTHYISPNELYVKIQSCLMLITGKDKLTPDQWKRCFPDPPLLPDYKTFDFLLLYKLIRHLCPLLRPTQGHKYTLIDDYIEILRLLYFYLIDISNRMHDGKFEESFKSVRDEVRRFQNLTKYKSNYNYEEELNKTIPKKLGYKYPKKEEQLGNMQFTLNSSEFSDKKGHPIVLTRCITNNKNRSVTLIGKVSETGENSKVHTVYWSKNGEKIENKVGERKYSKVTVQNPSLTINNVNHQDAGSYRFTAITSAGSQESEIVFGEPEIYMERHENPDGRRWFTAKIKSIPEAYHVQWKVKRNVHEDFSLIDVNHSAYKGTSNSLNSPVLVVQEKDLLENHFFHIKVDNFIGSSKKEIFDTPIQYLFYQPDQGFNHFHYVYNLIRNCKSRVENIHLSKEQNVVIKIGIVGIFHEDNLHLISGGTWKETLSEDQKVWDVSPVLCFQNDLPLNSVLKIIRKVDARHRIIIKSDTICKEAEKTEDSIVIVGKNKQKIKENITICLEEPFHQILKEWLEIFSNQGLTKLSSEIIAEIREIRKHLDFEKSKLTTGISCLQGGGIEFSVPYNVKDFLLRMPFVNSFGIWGTSSFKVFVQKETDKNEMEKELLNINKFFFDHFNLEIVNGKFVQKKTLKQGDHLLSCKRNDSGLYNAGTLGGFVRKNDNKRKIYALTCNHIFPEEKQLAYAKDFDGFKEMGTCVFTTREQACDFAAIELKDSFLDACDVTVRRDDDKKVNAKVYKKNLRNVGLVHKIGAATNVTSGRIISWEYYDKEMDSDCRESIFLVKGLNGPFSKEGDSGSLVFSRPNSVIQNYVNVLGMVYAQNITIDYDDDDNEDQHGTSAACNIADNISVCYRIHTALELFKKSQGEGFDVKFQDDLSVTLSSSLQSLRSDDSI